MRKRNLYIISIAILILPTYFIFTNYDKWERELVEGRLKTNVETVTQEKVKQACKHPQLDLWDPAIRSHFMDVPPIKCSEEPDWICVEKGIAKPCDFTVHQNAQCTYTFLKRVSDQAVPKDAYKVSVSLSKPVALASDFFRVKCKDKDTQQHWSNIVAGIRKDSKIHNRARWELLPNTSMKLNVLMWGFDSLSRMTFMRKLPNTYNYLTRELNALVLKDYNIVGDGTPQALIPIFTGKTELELPDTKKRMGKKATFVNVYPFVWNEYKANGYVTAYSEDCPSIGTFTYRLKGFNEEPTDHYMRTFYQVAEEEFKDHPPLCMRNVPRHKVLMNWVKQFFVMYKDKPKFMFTFHSELSHDDYNKVGAADDDLKDMLTYLKTNNHLNNTLLIIMSDHGHRFASFRETQQGKQEERLPFFSFAFPPWFEKKYPVAYKNFKTNTERLSTPFDIHPTLRDVLHFNGAQLGSTANRSISLFNEIPQNRSCSDAHIEPHWCACLNMEQVANDDSIVFEAAKAVVQFINNITSTHREFCSVLKLRTIIRAEMYIPTEGLLHFKKNSDYDGFQADLTDNTAVTVKLYQLKIRTEPGNGHFDATVRYDANKKSYIVNGSDISRTNKYGIAAACIMNTQHHLRPYCYCKNNIVKSIK